MIIFAPFANYRHFRSHWDRCICRDVDNDFSIMSLLVHESVSSSENIDSHIYKFHGSGHLETFFGMFFFFVFFDSICSLPVVRRNTIIKNLQEERYCIFTVCVVLCTVFLFFIFLFRWVNAAAVCSWRSWLGTRLRSLVLDRVYRVTDLCASQCPTLRFFFPTLSLLPPLLVRLTCLFVSVSTRRVQPFFHGNGWKNWGFTFDECSSLFFKCISIFVDRLVQVRVNPDETELDVLYEKRRRSESSFCQLKNLRKLINFSTSKLIEISFFFVSGESRISLIQ